MQANTALGLMEISSIAKGMETLDFMCKAAGIKPELHQAVSRGKYLIVISGPVGEVESSLAKGAEVAGNAVLIRHIIRNVHAGALAAIDRKIKPASIEAVGIVETKEALSALFAADAAAKAAFVHVAEIKLGKGIGGKGYFTVVGEPGAVRTAVSAGVKAVGEDAVVSRVVIPNAHEYMGAVI
ncbi:MAG: propanediol utilization protein [Elusimicrobia bacterium CG08_land_8_20_14_0_20_59_10]|nr:MAG: propanediol utilization protein [Elusimicrobia bacterium CG08_land_8_20_14_0_20_59_10]